MIVNGIAITPGNYGQSDAGSRKSLIASFFTTYTLSSTSYVYNGAGEQAASSGYVVVSGMDRKTIAYSVASPTGTVTIAVYGRINGIEANIVELSTAIAKTGFIEIIEGVEEMRVGIKISAGSATMNIVGKLAGNTIIQY